MSRPLALLAALALALSGCGAQASSASDFEGEERAVADVVEELQAAGEGRDGERICSELLARPLVDRLGSACATELETTIRDADAFELVVEDVAIQGTNARARVSLEDQRRTLELVRERAGWRIASLGA